MKQTSEGAQTPAARVPHSANKQDATSYQRGRDWEDRSFRYRDGESRGRRGDEQVRFTSVDRSGRWSGGEYGRSGGYEERGYRGGRERDEDGRFISDDERRGYGRGRDCEDGRRASRASGRGLGLGDPEAHAETSRRGRGEREGERRSSREKEERRGYSGLRYEQRSRPDDDDRRHAGHGGWFGDPEGHSGASYRGWEHRRQPNPTRKEAQMALFGKGIEDLNGLFADELKNAYYMENQIVDNLPDMIEAATSPELKQALSAHLEETKTQVTRLEKVFEMHGVRPENGSCPAIDGLIEVASAGPSDIDEKKVLDAAIVAAAQQIEHHEIAVYGSIMSWAKELGRDDCAAILSQTLDEEKAADRKLSTLAEGGINRMAA